MIQDSRWANVAPWELAEQHPLWRTWVRAARIVDYHAGEKAKRDGTTAGQRARIPLPAPPKSTIMGKRQPGGKTIKRPEWWGRDGVDPYTGQPVSQ